jgi:hypothetical protein
MANPKDNSAPDEHRRAIELTADRFYQADIIFQPGQEMPEHWTADLLPDGPGFYRPQYQGGKRKGNGEYTNGNWVDVNPAAAPTLEARRKARSAQLNADYSEAMRKVQEGWPTYEVLTWPTQAEEAKAWKAAPEDKKPETPFLSAMFQTRRAMGIEQSFADLIDRVITNQELYTFAVAYLTGVRHATEQMIEHSDNPEAVQWSFTLPASDAPTA